MNTIYLIGLVGGEPKQGQYDVSFTLATSEKIKKQDGSILDSTQWHNISVRGYAQGNVMSNIHKGDLVCVIGKQMCRQYTTQSGGKGYYYSVETSQVFKGFRKEDKAANGGGEDKERYATISSEQGLDNDLPF